MLKHICIDGRRPGRCAYCTARARAAINGVLDEFDLVCDPEFFPGVTFITNS